MNPSGVSLIWLFGQVTTLCTVTAVIYLIVRRRHPSAGVTAALSGLLLSALLTCLVVSPWPRWPLSRPSESPVLEVTTASPPAQSTQQTDQTPIEEGADKAATSPDVMPGSFSSSARETFWQGIGQEFVDPHSRQFDARYPWTRWLAPAFLLIMIPGAIRLLAGWVSVRRCLQRSRFIDDSSLNEQVEQLRGEIPCGHRVVLRESSEIASAATIGWKNPTILLPPCWRRWSKTERQAVLAHELAHISSGDAATCLLAQCALVLHFYHPLVHWLVHRLRFEQELAADDLAVRIVGNSDSYLATLAKLALHQPDCQAEWVTHTFLSSHGTLIRRISMLHDRQAPAQRSSSRRRHAVVATIFLAAIAIAGFRPQPAQSANAGVNADEKVDRKVNEKLDPTQQDTRLEHSRQNAMNIALALHLYHSSHKHFPPPVVLGPDGKTKHSWRVAILPFMEGGLELFNRYDQRQPWDSPNNRYVLERMPDIFRHPVDDASSTNTSYFALTGRHTAFGETLDEGVSRNDISDGLQHTLHVVEAKRNVPWTKPVDIAYSSEDRISDFGGFFPGSFIAVSADGAGRIFSHGVDDATLRAAITRDGGEAVDINQHSRFKP